MMVFMSFKILLNFILYFKLILFILWIYNLGVIEWLIDWLIDYWLKIWILRIIRIDLINIDYKNEILYKFV